MNLQVSDIPENWNPGCVKSFNRWATRIHNHEKRRYGIPIRTFKNKN